MSKKHFYWTLPLVLAGAGASAQQDQVVLPDLSTPAAQPPPEPAAWQGPILDRRLDERIDVLSTNRLTLSVRYALNIKGSFHGVGNPFSKTSIFGLSRLTPDGDHYNFDDGYVLRDAANNNLGYTSYWGYDNSSQVNAGGFPANTIEFHQTTASASGSSAGDVDQDPGVEITYDRQLGEKEDWHHLRYGMEGAMNYMKTTMHSDSTVAATLLTTTTAFSYFPGSTPPPAPFQGTRSGSGYMFLQVPPLFPTSVGPTTVTPGATLFTHDDFSADIWGFRVGPYMELPLSRRIELRLSGGFAAGLIYGDDTWRQVLTPSGGPAIMATGGGTKFGVLWGGYVSVNGTYQFNERWGVAVGAQFQDLGRFTHSFQGRVVDLDLSQSLFVEAGISYNF